MNKYIIYINIDIEEFCYGPYTELESLFLKKELESFIQGTKVIKIVEIKDLPLSELIKRYRNI